MDAHIDLTQIERLYSDYTVKPLSYGTVRDYCDSFDHLRALATANGDLKDCQRSWMLKAILSKIRGKGRLLEFGAGEPLVADLLQRLGHEVWIVDPYEGYANGPTELARLRAQYPNLKFIPTVFDDRLALPKNSFDCIFSISVLEHVPASSMNGVFAGVRRFLNPDGITIHAIDHVLRGQGADWHVGHLRQIVGGLGLSVDELGGVLDAAGEDPETYYLSAEGHNRWRNGVPYDQFPMRSCISIQVAAEASGLRTG